MLKIDYENHGTHCDETCQYYHRIDFKSGWCEFCFSHPSMGEKEYGQECDLEDYLNYPIFYSADKGDTK